MLSRWCALLCPFLCVPGPVSPTPLAVASQSRVSFPAALGELWGAGWLCTDLVQQLQRADERWKGFVASCCTLSASWSSGLSFLETKAGLSPASAQSGLALVALVTSGTSRVAVVAQCCSSHPVQLSLHITAVTAESS